VPPRYRDGISCSRGRRACISGFPPLITTISPSNTRAGCQHGELGKFRELPGQLCIVPAPEGDRCSDCCNSPDTVPLISKSQLSSLNGVVRLPAEHRPVAGNGHGHFRPRVAMVSCSAWHQLSCLLGMRLLVHNPLTGQFLINQGEDRLTIASG